MAEKVLVNLATGLEDSERVTVAFLVAGAGLEGGREVAMFLTKEAVWPEPRRCGSGLDTSHGRSSATERRGARRAPPLSADPTMLVICAIARG